MSRTVVWFSAGAASAVAAKLTLASANDVVIAYTDPGSEHPDNARFITDCERWFDAPVVRLKSDHYLDTWDVWAKRRFIVSPAGALCTTELKKMVRHTFERPDDVQVFGYTAEEQHRADRFRQQNPEVDLRTPLVERGLTKSDCLAMIDRAGIELPAMYRLGYRNNNCIGCPKGWDRLLEQDPPRLPRCVRPHGPAGTRTGCVVSARGDRRQSFDDPVVSRRARPPSGQPRRRAIVRVLTAMRDRRDRGGRVTARPVPVVETEEPDNG